MRLEDFLFVLAPNHIRANNNKIYYETILENRTLTKQQQAGIVDSSNLQSMKYQINNQRPDDYLEERDIYEKLCRQNGTEVERLIYLVIIFDIV